jgi:hypothetical protein
MIDNRFLAGVIAGIPVSLLCLGYAVARTEYALAVFTSGGGGEAMSRTAATATLWATAALIGPCLGLISAAVYGWMPSQTAYVALALGLATLMSLAAVVAHTPMTVEKIVLNYAVAVCLGLLMPRLLVP